MNVQDSDAVCWCAVGSLEKECGNSAPSWIESDKGAKKLKAHPYFQAAHRLLEQAAGTVFGWPSASITAVNDGSGHEEVIRMYNKAISLAKGR